MNSGIDVFKSRSAWILIAAFVERKEAHKKTSKQRSTVVESKANTFPLSFTSN
jgi:hypothetical protein